MKIIFMGEQVGSEKKKTTPEIYFADFSHCIKKKKLIKTAEKLTL